MQQDLTDAVQWAIKNGIADPKRICIAGEWLRGTFAQLMSLGWHGVDLKHSTHTMRKAGGWRCCALCI